MDCTYFKKARLFKRIFGIKGYCCYHDKYIKKHQKINYPPYFQCKGINNKDLSECSIQVRLSDKKN
jgi:hypothetical protein